MLCGHCAKITLFVRIALQCRYQLFYHIIDVNQCHLSVPVVHLNRQFMCNIVAKGSHSAVVVGTAPFAKHVREAVYQHICTRLTTVIKQQIFAGLF